MICADQPLPRALTAATRAVRVALPAKAMLVSVFLGVDADELEAGAGDGDAGLDV
jgi:hypothetical protein